jgi:hypothetical protein
LTAAISSSHFAGVLPRPNNLYHQLRVRCGAVPSLGDSGDSPPERLLQSVWQHQRLHRAKLRSSDGRAITILHPGFWSFEGGPDFRKALVQFDNDTPKEGDIEVDVHPSGWRAHGHHANPAFSNVVLHVVWRAEKAAVPGLPQLALDTMLDSPIGELNLWLNSDGLRELPAEFRGRCCAPLSKLDGQAVLALLDEAAEVRLAAKGSWFTARAREAGWEQSLWEALFRALGYKNNSWPMQRIGELRPRWSEPGKRTPLEIQARLFGISGLLPADVRAVGAEASFPRKLWDGWWRDRDGFSDCVLPRDAWRLHGLRPANHPQRRLALASHWAGDGSLPARLETWCARDMRRAELAPSLLELLQAPQDDFWSWHWTMRSARMPRPQPLLGETRVTDLAINVVLPWLAVRAVEGGNPDALDAIRRRYFEWPAAEDNSVLKFARQRLLGVASKKLFHTAAAQQGLIQIVRDYCDHSNSICDRCRLPEMVGEWRSAMAEKPL